MGPGVLVGLPIDDGIRSSLDIWMGIGDLNRRLQSPVTGLLRAQIPGQIF